MLSGTGFSHLQARGAGGPLIRQVPSDTKSTHAEAGCRQFCCFCHERRHLGLASTLIIMPGRRGHGYSRNSGHLCLNLGGRLFKAGALLLAGNQVHRRHRLCAMRSDLYTGTVYYFRNQGKNPSLDRQMRVQYPALPKQSQSRKDIFIIFPQGTGTG